MKDYLKHLFDFRRLLQARNLPFFNLVLFVSVALSGYLQYFLRQAPPEKSLWVGVAFTVITGLYLLVIRQREGV